MKTLLCQCVLTASVMMRLQRMWSRVPRWMLFPNPEEIDRLLLHFRRMPVRGRSELVLLQEKWCQMRSTLPQILQFGKFAIMIGIPLFTVVVPENHAEGLREIIRTVMADNRTTYVLLMV